MKITCPSCQTSYNLPENSIGEGGRTVKCANCSSKWYVDSPPPISKDPVLDAVATDHEETAEDDWSEALEDGKVTFNKKSSEPIDADFEPDDDDGSDMEVDEAAAASSKVPLNPVNPLLRTADRRSLRSRLREARPEDIKALRRQKIARPMIFVATLLLFASVALIREPISRQLPDLASLYQTIGLDVNLTGFDIRNVKSERVIESSGPVLIVSGEIENITDSIAQAPRLRFGLKTNTNEEIYTWEYQISVPTIVPGGVARFQSRLPSPPTLGRNLSVQFVENQG